MGGGPDSFEMDNGWGDGAASSGPSGAVGEQGGAGGETRQDDLQTVLEKEKVIKDIMTTQEGLRALLDRINEVTDDIKKLSEENATLQIYLDNMTRNTAMLAAAGKGDKR